MSTKRTLNDAFLQIPNQIREASIVLIALGIMMSITLAVTLVFLMIPGKGVEATAWATFSLVLVGAPAVFYGYRNFHALQEGNEELKRKNLEEVDFHMLRNAASLFTSIGVYDNVGKDSSYEYNKVRFVNTGLVPFYNVIPFLWYPSATKAIPFSWMAIKSTSGQNPKKDDDTLNQFKLGIEYLPDSTPETLQVATWAMIPPHYDKNVLFPKEETFAFGLWINNIMKDRPVGTYKEEVFSFGDKSRERLLSDHIALLYTDIYGQSWWALPQKQPERVDFEEHLQVLLGDTNKVTLMHLWTSR